MSRNQVSPSPMDMELDRVDSGQSQEPEQLGSTDQVIADVQHNVEDINLQNENKDHLKKDELDPFEDHDTTAVSSSGRDSVSKISLQSSEEVVRKTPDFTVNPHAYSELTPVDETQQVIKLQDSDIMDPDDMPEKQTGDMDTSTGERETSAASRHSFRPESRFVEYENEGLVYEPGLPMPDTLHEPQYVAPSEDSRLHLNDKGYYTESSALARTSTPEGRDPQVFNKEPTAFTGMLGGPALPSTASNQVVPVDEGTYHLAEMRQRQSGTQKDDSLIIGADENTDGPGCCGWLLYIFSVLLILLTLPFSLIFTIKVVQEYERAVIFRLGRLPSGGAKGPGIFFIIPCIESYTKVDLRTVSFDIPPQEVLTKDSVTVSVDAVVYYRVSNPTVSVANVENAHHSTRLLAQTTLRNILGTKNMTEILSDREAISQGMQTTLDEATDRWGIKVERVEIKDVRLPVQLQRAMAAEAEAAREARAKVIAAEGEQKAAKSLKEAADVIAQTGAALQLRYLQTLNSISAEKNSTIIFPLPMDMMSSFMKK